MPDQFVSTDFPRADQDAAFDAIRPTITVDAWDLKSPINGVPAEHWLNRDDLKGVAEIALVWQNGVVTQVQPLTGQTVAEDAGALIDAATANQALEHVAQEDPQDVPKPPAAATVPVSVPAPPVGPDTEPPAEAATPATPAAAASAPPTT